jgi:hypothetical protein
MRRPRKSGGGSLDSLLDTMTNVVGILVILLTVTQLGVSDAVKRIGDTESVKPEALEAVLERLRELLAVRAELEARLKALGQEDDGVDAAERLRKLRKRIADYQADTEVLSENEAKKRQAELELLAWKEEAERRKKEADELLARRNTGAEELASMRAKLAEAIDLGPVQPKIIYLPNPRPAPEGAKPSTFLCREGRVMAVDAEQIQDWAQKRAAFIIQRRRLGRDPAAGIDPKILVDEFNQDPGRDRNFDVRMTVAGRVPKLVLKRKPEAGETAEQIERTTSRYQQQIRRTAPGEFYLQFLVWPDSFEVYLKAREIAASRGLLAGWKPQTTTGEHVIEFGANLLLGPPPPPPKPRPKPKEEEKPKPETKPKPTPPPRPVPVDVVD